MVEAVFRLAIWTHWSEAELHAMPLRRFLRYLKMTPKTEG